MSLDRVSETRFIDEMNLPNKVKIVEVGPRDGLQNHPASISVDNKVALINRISDCGFTAIEVGSLVSPEKVPQMADSETVYKQIERHPGNDYIVLVPNKKGLDRALTCQVKNIAVFCAATDAFSLKNIDCTVDESLANIKTVCEFASANNINVRGYVSCVLGCPYQGSVDLEQVCRLAERLFEFGCYEISLGDTIGVGTPGRVRDLVTTAARRIPIEKIAVHFHDSYGQALANILAALQSGVAIVDSSVSGLGGCPFAAGASGNVASEDVVYMLNGLGIETGIDMDRLVSTSWFIADILRRPPTAKVAQALATKYR